MCTLSQALAFYILRCRHMNGRLDICMSKQMSLLNWSRGAYYSRWSVVTKVCYEHISECLALVNCHCSLQNSLCVAVKSWILSAEMPSYWSDKDKGQSFRWQPISWSDINIYCLCHNPNFSQHNVYEIDSLMINGSINCFKPLDFAFDVNAAFRS